MAKSRKVHQTRRGGGLFNRFRSWIGKPKKNTTVPRGPPLLQPSKTARSARTHYGTFPKSVVVQNPLSAAGVNGPRNNVSSLRITKPRGPRFSNLEPTPPNNVVVQNPLSDAVDPSNVTHESLGEGIERSLAFAFQKLDGGVPNPRKLRTTPQEKKILRERYLRAIYNPATQKFDADFKTLEQLSQELFGQPLAEFEKELQDWENGVTINRTLMGRVPFTASSSLYRLIPYFRASDREIQYVSNTEPYWCKGNVKTDDSIKTLNQNACVLVGENLHWFLNPEENPFATSGKLYIVIHPKFYARQIPPRYKSTYYQNAAVNQTYTSSLVPMQSKMLLANSSVLDALSKGGLTCIHPRLGWMLQTEAPELWNQFYWLPKFDAKGAPNYTAETDVREVEDFVPFRAALANSNLDKILRQTPLQKLLRIVLLTFQEASAMRRWSWTHNQKLCSDVYEKNYAVPPLNAELLRPDIQVGDYVFNEAEFNNKLVENQQWAAGTVLFRSWRDPKLRVLYNVSEAAYAAPQMSWATPTRRRNRVQEPIVPLAEEANVLEGFRQVAAQQQTRRVPYTRAPPAYRHLRKTRKAGF